MTSTVRVFKGLLTKRNQTILDWLNESATLIAPLPESDAARRELGQNVRQALKKCEDYLSLLETSMVKLANAFDSMEDHSDEDHKQFDKYMESTQETMMKLHVHKSDLERVLTDCTVVEREDQQRRATATANVHDQELSELQKFNYLLSSLRGEAKQSISRYHVTSCNYQKAIEHLQKRYGNKEGIVMELNKYLTTCAARGSSTSDQRQLYDKLSSTAAQLQEHGENLNNQLTIHTFLHKFHVRIQKAATEKRFKTRNLDGSEWSLSHWLDAIEDAIAQEEQLKEIISTESELRQKFSSPKDRWNSAMGCECCGQKGHKWNTCPRIPSPSARRTFLVESKRCLNCGSTNHRVSSCSSSNCRKCEGKHHTAICSKGATALPERETRSSTVPSPPREFKPRISSYKKVEKTTKQPHGQSRQHLITAETAKVEPESDAVVLHMNENQHYVQGNRKKVILLAGSARVYNSEKNAGDVTVLLDTGSELSFIDEHLAQDLELSAVGRTSLLISTFDSSKPCPKECEIISLKLCDIEGVEHDVNLYRSDFITAPIEQADLEQHDLDFIGKQEITLSFPMKRRVLQPQILLGCDYLWNFMMPMGRLILPSGLQLIPTKFGYIISGRQMSHAAHPSAVLTLVNSGSEKELWDRYWSLESSGTDEYTGSQRTELQLLNEKVLQDFKRTIQRREDGYYVRLPWKDKNPALPDNKLIALKRLEKVLEMYSADVETLRQYDSIFHEQEEKGIIEEVPPERSQEGNVIHYLPHQAVITPLKETTKMRIVFDASAHYKNCPSLNDVLHQGPLMLPDMVGMLLRFQAHNIAVISDVEKAFLQVRLQEIDRDATRCLWVRDVTRPVTPDNIIIYRFTRVTFGLNTSPFLLGATIEFHLEQLGATNAMVEEIRGNLYVDNLIYGARTAEDALMKYHQSKRIFDGLNMNLREFMSNDEGFNTCIPAQDRSSNLHPKVLGIHWNTKTDRIILKGTMAPRKESLWRDEFAWDVTLPPNLHEQWRIISSQVSTFYKELDRQFMLHPDNNCTLFAFSDASQFAIATCVYIGCNENVQLAMAKSKLPSLKASITIPKLEMNALILSARVVNFICKALDSLCRIQEVIFFTDSEIVLGWIRSPPARKSVGTLISNRLNELRRIVEDLNESGTECRFGYISTTENPADCGTRGLSADALQNHFWWKGPKLIQNFAATRGVDDVFPMSPPKDESHDETPITTTVASLMTTEERKLDEATLFNLSRFSSLYKAKRAVSYVIRFLSRSLRNLPALRKETILKNIPALKVAASTFELKGDELREAKRCLIRDHQTVIVSEHRIKTQKNLNIQKDEDGILRCYGRLQHADLSTPTKTPIYIAPKTALARLIILEAHGHYHSGVAHTMAKIRENYWIPRLRQQVES